MRHYAPPPRVHFVMERRIFPKSAAHGHPRRWGASTVASEDRRIPGATPQRRHQNCGETRVNSQQGDAVCVMGLEGHYSL